MDIKQQTKNVAAQGRYGDSMLLHVNPAEVRGLASAMPITINPETGQPEAFLPFLAPIIGSMAGGALFSGALGSVGASALGAGLAQYAVTGDLKKGLLAGLTGYGLGTALQGAGAAAEAAKTGTEAASAAAQTAAADAVASGATDAAVQEAVMGSLGESAASQAAAQTFANPVTGAVQNLPYNIAPSAVEAGAQAAASPTAFQNLQSAFTAPGTIDPATGAIVEGSQGFSLGAGGSNLLQGAMQPGAYIPAGVGMGGTSIIESQEAFQKYLNQLDADERKRVEEMYAKYPEMIPGTYVAEGGLTAYQRGGRTDFYEDFDYRDFEDMGDIPSIIGESIGVRGGGLNSAFGTYVPQRQANPIPQGYMAGFMPEFDYFSNVNPSATALSGPNVGNIGADGMPLPPPVAPQFNPTQTAAYQQFYGSAAQGVPQVIDPTQPTQGFSVPAYTPPPPPEPPVTPPPVDGLPGEPGDGPIGLPDPIMIGRPVPPSVGLPKPPVGDPIGAPVPPGGKPPRDDFISIGGPGGGFDNVRPMPEPIDLPMPMPMPIAPPMDRPMPIGEPEPIAMPIAPPQIGLPEPKPVQLPEPMPIEPISPIAAPMPIQPRPIEKPIELPAPIARPLPVEPIAPPVNVPMPQPMPEPIAMPMPEPIASPQPIPIAQPQPISPAPQPMPMPEPIAMPKPIAMPDPVVMPMPAPPVQQPIVPIEQPISEPIAPPMPEPIAAPVPKPVAPIKAPEPLPIAQPVLPPVMAPVMPPVNVPMPMPIAQPLPVAQPMPVAPPMARPMPMPGGMPMPMPRSRRRGMEEGGETEFPDLSGDGKVTQKDILIGKGVIEKFAGGNTELVNDPLTKNVIDFIMGNIQDDSVVAKFIDKYGPDIFRNLRRQVLASLAPNAQTEGMIEGDNKGGMADDIYGVIGDPSKNGERVAVSQDEFIVPADVVSMLGDGSSDAGADKLYAMMDKVRQEKTNTTKQAKPINDRRVMPS